MASRASAAALGILALVIPAGSSAVTGSSSVSQAPPRAGNWHYVKSDYLGVKPTTRINAKRTRVGNVSVVPIKGSGCAVKRVTVKGSFLLRQGGVPGDTWYVGDPATSDHRVPVTVKQGSKNHPGELAYDFFSPARGRGEVIVENKKGKTLCDLYFRIAAPKKK